MGRYQAIDPELHSHNLGLCGYATLQGRAERRPFRRGNLVRDVAKRPEIGQGVRICLRKQVRILQRSAVMHPCFHLRGWHSIGAGKSFPPGLACYALLCRAYKTPGNVVVTCAPYNSGRVSFTLEEVGLVPPRARDRER